MLETKEISETQKAKKPVGGARVQTSRGPVPAVLRLAHEGVLKPEELVRLQEAFGNRAIAYVLAERMAALDEGKRIDLTAPIEVDPAIIDATTKPQSSHPDVSQVPENGPTQEGTPVGDYSRTPIGQYSEGSNTPIGQYSEGYYSSVESYTYVSEASVNGPGGGAIMRPNPNSDRPLPVPSVQKPLKTSSGYTTLRPRVAEYFDEFINGSKHLRKDIIGLMGQKVAAGLIRSVAEGMQLSMGWSQDDCDKFLPKVIPARQNNPDDPGKAPPVRALSEDERASFELHGGSKLTQGDPPVVYDTSQMFSKFMKNGYAIFVMDKSGRIFSAQHKVGLFHHSSFLAGAAVAGAGEMRVESGTLKAISNKSGHYQPRAEEMVQVLDELRVRGVDLTSVDYIHMVGSTINRTPWGKASEFLNRFKHNPQLAPH
ncbi:hypothetical protein [Ferrimicrobium sp.]|uniref:hypothetical protein n=1 Tax=Ferrimicrobium sp. TaxID=2926050 RepID=UPI00261BB7FB|nr:hypothetical protein [Ferrimicrobium sp.]